MQFFPIIVVALVCAAVMFFNFNRLKQNRAASAEFLAQHPDAAKVYLVAKAFITSESVQVISVDGAPPKLFYEGTKGGFYALPGKRTAELSYTHNRPGIIYKNVSESTGVVKKELALEPKTSYLLGFNRDTNEFTLDLFSPGA
jgi:hypothetical protein